MAHRRSDGSSAEQAVAVVESNHFQRRAGRDWARRGVLFLAGLSVVGCTSGPVEEQGPTTVKIGVPESRALSESTGVDEFARALTLEGLVRVGPDGHAIPWLAKELKWEESSTRLRIQLRPDVFLHDGTQLKAALASELLKRSIEAEEDRALYPALNDIASISTEGDLDVVLTLSRPSPQLPVDLGLPIRTGESGAVGTGPFRVVSSSPEKVELQGFERYYLGKPTVSAVVITPFDTLRTAWASLLRGQLDVVSDVPADAVEFVRNDDVQVIPYARRYQYLIAFNSRRGALRSAAVRRAVNLAIDRPALIERVLQGRGTPSTGPLWPQYWAYDKSVQPYAFDPEQASAALDAAGFRMPKQAAGVEQPARLRFTCLVLENFSVHERIALEVQRSLLNIGVDMDVQAVSFQEFGKRIVSGNFDAILNDMISGPTPGRAYVFWRSRSSYRSNYNVFGYENAEAEKLFSILNSSTNDAAVRSATGRLQQVLLNDPPALFLAWNARARAIRNDFTVPTGTGDPIGSLWKWTPAAGARPAARQ